MALMKTGRKMSMPKGEDPKKPKAQQEVKVTAQKQNEPPQKRYYTQEEYNKNEATKARNRAAKEQYESDVSNYNRSMKLYNEGASFDVSNESISMMNKSGSKVKGKPVTYTAATGGTSAKEMSDAYDKGIKSGEYVDIDDPRISEKNRYYLKGAMLSSRNNATDQFGTTTNRAVPASIAFEKDLNFKKIYGGEDFDPYEFEKASKSGKFDEYSKKQGMSGKSYAPSFGMLQKYGKPEQAKAPTYEREENIGLEKVIPEKMKLLKPTIKTKKGELAGVSTKEKGDWEAPSRTKTVAKTRFKGASNANTFERGPLKSTRVVDLKRSGLKEERVKGYNREAKMAKAYFGGGYEGKSKFDIEGSSEGPGIISELKGKKKEIKARIRGGEGDVMTQQGRKAELKDVKSNIRQAKLASKYVTKLGQEFTGVTEGENLYRTGKIKTFTPEAMAGFSGSKQNTYDVNANKKATQQKRIDAFKSQLSNKANQNTISSQIDKLEPKRTRSQRIEERKTQRQVMRNLPK
jgi:hypothetical protein